MSDYNFLMESRLSPEQFQVLTQVSRAAVEQGMNLYLVGGAVRDLTYGQQTVHDLDFVMEGNPERVLRRLESAKAPPARPDLPPMQAGEPIPWRIDSVQWDGRLKSAEVHLSNGVRIELAMSRNEIYSQPERPPEISPAMIFDDLKRRDFSANAMAVSLHPNSRGLLLDPTNGAADIEKRELRGMHSRSFSEDPSRLYRLLTLGLRLGFKPEERTRTYFETALENRLWERLEPKQQGRELRAILYEENPGRVLKTLVGRGLLAGLDRQLSPRKIPVERFAKIRAVCQTVPRSDPFLLNFHCLVQNVSGGQRIRLAKKIIGDAKTIRTALDLEREAKKLAQALSSSKNALPSRVYTLLSGQPQTLLLFLLAYHPNAKIQNKVKSFLHKYPLIRARLPRAEFQAMGMKPGPKFEKILEQVFFDQLDGKINTHQQAIKELRRLSGIKEPPPPPKPARSAKAPKSAAKLAKETEKGGEPSKPLKPAAAAHAAKERQTPAKPIAASKPVATAPLKEKTAKPEKHAAPAKPHKKEKEKKLKKKARR